MKITIFGSGYVGLVTGACLAEVGNHVLCVDVDPDKVARLKAGEIPIYEPGLEAIVQRQSERGQLQFTTDMDEAVAFAEIQFIAVGTPSDEDGSADLRYVLDVARTIGERMTERRVVVDKSTVPVGTADKVRETIAAELARRGERVEFDVVSNPEFLKEGAAVDDFLKPDRIIVGTDSEYATRRMRELYAPFSRKHDKMIVMDIRSAELTKYAANAMLATKISFMNEIANLADLLGADVEKVRQGIGSDPRIGFHFIYPGCGYGGSCFPKDVKALIATAKAEGYTPRLLDAVEAVNDSQKSVVLDKLIERFGADLSQRVFALWGLSFKPKTDDMREAPSRVVMEGLWERGARIKAYDPVAMAEARRLYPNEGRLTLVSSPYEALIEADALIINTEWSEFRSPDFERLAELLNGPIVFDGRNIYDPVLLEERGFEYYCIGRPRAAFTRPTGDRPVASIVSPGSSEG